MVFNGMTYQLRCMKYKFLFMTPFYEGWNFNSGNYLFTIDTK